MRRYPIETNLLNIDLTAMIDVIFILLIFWLTVARLQADPDPRVETPRADAAAARSIPAKLLTINMLAGGNRLSVLGQEMDAAALLQRLAAEPLPEHVLIRAPAEIDCRRLTRLTASLRGAGIERIGLAVRQVGA
jgi:biopolymer transport protein ExbD